MEKDDLEPFPPEIWSHILSYLDDFNDWVELKIVNKLFYQDLSARNPFDGRIKISEDDMDYFKNRNTKRIGASIPAMQQELGILGKSLRFKTIVVGQAGVGKTSLLHRYVRGQFQEWAETTMSPAFPTKIFEDPNGITTTLDLWDTMGQERYRALVRAYYRGARGVFMCFSIDDKQSFITLVNKFVPDMCKEFRQYAPEQQPVIYLIGLKSDLEDQRQVSTKEAKVLARVLNVKYFECSAKTNTNIDEMMQSMKEDLHRTIRTADLGLPDPAPNNPNANQGSSRWCSIQ